MAITALCEAEIMSSSYGYYNWPVTFAEDTMSIACQYGAASESSTPLVVMATRYCDPRGEWRESNFSECANFADSTLRNISMVCAVDRACVVIADLNCSQLPLTDLSDITQGIFDSVVQATDSEGQDELNIDEIAQLYENIAEDCGTTMGVMLFCVSFEPLCVNNLLLFISVHLVLSKFGI